MAVRYSGDVEVRLHWNARQRRYLGTVRDPHHAIVADVGPVRVGDPRDPKAYDVAAEHMIEAATRQRGRLLDERRRGRVVIRRVFQAPCPVSCPSMRKGRN